RGARSSVSASRTRDCCANAGRWATRSPTAHSWACSPASGARAGRRIEPEASDRDRAAPHRGLEGPGTDAAASGVHPIPVRVRPAYLLGVTRPRAESTGTGGNARALPLMVSPAHHAVRALRAAATRAPDLNPARVLADLGEPAPAGSSGPSSPDRGADA